MIDFLRANTWCSQEEYKWGMSVAQIRLSGYDFTRVEYLKEKNKKNKALQNEEMIDSAEDLLKGITDLHTPIINTNKTK